MEDAISDRRLGSPRRPDEGKTAGGKVLKGHVWAEILAGAKTVSWGHRGFRSRLAWLAEVQGGEEG